MISRKKFLHLAGLGIVSSLVPNFLLARFVESSSIDNDVPTLLKAARRLRKQGRLNAAKNKYEQVLALDASEIRAYNGIRKILLSKKHKELEVIQLYQQASANIPTNLRIKRRLYSQYTKAALGNKKITGQLNIPGGRILTYVKERYEELLLQNYPNKKNLEKELAKIDKYIALNVDIVDTRKNKELKKYRRENRNAHKQRFNHLTAQETVQELAALKAKEPSNDRLPQIREMSKVNISALRAEKDYNGALDAASIYLETIDKSDPYFIKQFRELSKQLNNIDDLVRFENYNHTQKKTFWSALALFDVYFKQSEVLNSPGSSVMDSLIQEISSRSENPQQNFETITRQVKYLILKGDFTGAKTKLFALCLQKAGTSDAHSIDRVNLIIAKFYSRQGSSNDISRILEIVNNPTRFIENEDELTRHTALLNLNRSNNKPIHLQQLQQNINNL
ncbi:tetratricopeptide repeat protein [Epilithonimonas hungarica]|uniref:Tetratricopeptide repeat-containing protein n=1 Tax=Epilithonimonas hungarica TaxID=454006 RepID=A0A1G7LQ81_9FLAO|nr:hypothetical protein [Epilithonimonas hungarica]SDF51160.1 hypothetical protein SAMN05421825_1556 [Epilithonimonas hungarica]